MTVFIVGLGLIGASYAACLTQKKYDVYGYDINRTINQKAVDDGVCISTSLTALPKADLIISALYPKATAAFVKAHQHHFKPNAIFTDVSGVKQTVLQSLASLLRHDIIYMSHHPMAGKATPGYEALDATLFEGKNVIVIDTPKAKQHHKTTFEKLLHDLGFSTITYTNAKHHDALIAHTSQLPHVLAMNLIDINQENNVMRFTGNSYRDLTRVASINETLWSELFLENKDALVENIDRCISSLKHVKAMLEKNDERTLEKWMRSVKQKRDNYGHH